MKWRMRNTNTSGANDLEFVYGDWPYRPVAGDYDGNGTETVGVFVAYG